MVCILAIELRKKTILYQSILRLNQYLTHSYKKRVVPRNLLIYSPEFSNSIWCSSIFFCCSKKNHTHSVIPPFRRSAFCLFPCVSHFDYGVPTWRIYLHFSASKIFRYARSSFFFRSVL